MMDDQPVIEYAIKQGQKLKNFYVKGGKQQALRLVSKEGMNI